MPKTMRKLATILAADVVGFSKMMDKNEVLTLENLKSCRDLIDPIIGEYGGRIFHTAGDSVIAEFASPVSCVDAAIEFQNILFITWLFTLIIWFVEAPAIRFGFSYITINLFMLNYLALKALNLNFIQHKKSNYLMKIFYLLIFMMIIYQFFRIITQ